MHRLSGWDLFRKQQTVNLQTNDEGNVMCSFQVVHLQKTASASLHDHCIHACSEQFDEMCGDYMMCRCSVWVACCWCRRECQRQQTVHSCLPCCPRKTPQLRQTSCQRWVWPSSLRACLFSLILVTFALSFKFWLIVKWCVNETLWGTGHALWRLNKGNSCLMSRQLLDLKTELAWHQNRACLMSGQCLLDIRTMFAWCQDCLLDVRTVLAWCQDCLLDVKTVLAWCQGSACLMSRWSLLDGFTVLVKIVLP